MEEVPDDAKEPDEGYRVCQEDLCGDRPDVPPEIGGVAGEGVDAVCDEHVPLALVLFDLVVKVRPCRVHCGRAEELSYDDAYEADDDEAGRLLERREEEVLDAVLQDAEGPRDPPCHAVVYEEGVACEARRVEEGDKAPLPEVVEAQAGEEQCRGPQCLRADGHRDSGCEGAAQAKRDPAAQDRRSLC